MNESHSPTYTCPWWLLFTFDNPVRHLVHDPYRLLASHVKPGDTALDVGCGMGYFTLPMARLVGPAGRVIAADLQQEMLDGLHRRAPRATMLDRVALLRCTPDRIGLEQPVDFALAFWMVHEVRQPEPFLKEIAGALRPGGRLLVVEPKLHVTGSAFECTVSMAQNLGLAEVDRPPVWGSRAILFQNQTQKEER
jgi:ubiquinone/menaquinone biosynthesis C-methylase UbiE